MRNVWLLLVLISGCVSQQQINGTVRVERVSFRGTNVVRADMMMSSANANVLVAVTGERGGSAIILSLRVGSSTAAPYASCFVEAATGSQVIDLPRPQYRLEPIAGGFSLAYEHFVVPLTLAQAETLFRGAPRFRVCNTAFFPTSPQVATFHRFWEEYSPPPIPLVRTQ